MGDNGEMSLVRSAKIVETCYSASLFFYVPLPLLEARPHYFLLVYF